MIISYIGHLLRFKLEARELNAPDNACWRFIEEIKKNIKPEHRDYDSENKEWYIDRKYEPILKILKTDYFKE